MTEITRSPPVAGAVVAVVVGLFSAGTAAAGGVEAAVIAAAAAVLLAVGATRGHRRAVTWAAGLFVAAILISGLRGGPVGPLVVATVTAAVAYDTAEHAVGLGEQVGRDAPSRRNVLVHAATSLGIGSTVAAGGYIVYLLAAAGQPVTALVFLVVGAVILLAVVR